MRRSYERSSMSPLLRPVRFLLVSLFLTLISFFGMTAPVFAQTTADVCRETLKVLNQYEKEGAEVVRTLNIINHENSVRAMLSELRKAITNGYIMSGLDAAERYSGLYAPTSSKERLAFQRTLRTALERELQIALNSNKDDLEQRDRRIFEQRKSRLQKMDDLNCLEVLKRESSSSDLPNLTGTWTCKAKCPAGGEGKTANIAQNGQSLTFTNEGGGKSEGRFQGSTAVVATQWGNLTATIANGGKELHWANGTIWVKQ